MNSSKPLARRTRIKICGLTREQDVDAAEPVPVPTPGELDTE